MSDLVEAARASVRGDTPDPLVRMIPDGRPLRASVVNVAMKVLGRDVVREILIEPYVDRQPAMMRSRLRREIRRPSRTRGGEQS